MRRNFGYSNRFIDPRVTSYQLPGELPKFAPATEDGGPPLSLCHGNPSRRVWRSRGGVVELDESMLLTVKTEADTFFFL